MIQLLARKGIPAATVDSSDRAYPPRCHPDTRANLRSRIVEWVSSDSRHRKMLWVLGPAGVGKSALAQTLAEEYQETGCLGATFFFSRPHHWDDPDTVIPTLAYQLAIRNSPYKSIITKRLAEDPMILEKNRRAQFKELITDPLQILMVRSTSTSIEPVLIVLDGLDECKSREAQCEFVELIASHARLPNRFPLLWMICSRAEWHFKSMLSNADIQTVCQREELTVDDDEAQKDVVRVFRDGFDRIRQQYQDRLDSHWPSEAHVRQLAAAASGIFSFASTILRFVGDDQYSDPQGQLEDCLKFIGGSGGAPGALSPLHALDFLYRQVLSDVPLDVLPTTMRILGLLILYPQDRLFPQDQANFLGLDRTSFYRALQNLHSVLDVPGASKSHSTPLRFYHASFSDFLRDRVRSGNFALDEALVHRDIAIQSTKWQRIYATPSESTNKHSYPILIRIYFIDISPGFRWLRPKEDEELVLDTLNTFSLDFGWKACSRVSGANIPELVAELEMFDFGKLPEVPKDPTFSDGYTP